MIKFIFQCSSAKMVYTVLKNCMKLWFQILDEIMIDDTAPASSAMEVDEAGPPAAVCQVKHTHADLAE